MTTIIFIKNKNTKTQKLQYEIDLYEVQFLGLGT